MRIAARMITVTDVSKTFDSGRKKALSNVSFTVQPGEIIALLGHNGAGKSTLIDILCSIQKPDYGTISYSIPIQELGWCPQRQVIDWSLTAKQNISIAYELSSKKSFISQSSVEDVIRIFKLESYAHRTAETLSGGELRRIQIARALVNHPQLAILDEPTTGLDPDAIQIVFNYIKNRFTAGKTTIISTHETARFAHHCTRVIALHMGKIIADMPTQEFMKISTDKHDLWEAYKRHAPQ